MKVLYNDAGYCKVLTFENCINIKIMQNKFKFQNSVYQAELHDFIVMNRETSYLVTNADFIQFLNSTLYIYFDNEVPKVVKF